MTSEEEIARITSEYARVEDEEYQKRPTHLQHKIFIVVDSKTPECPLVRFWVPDTLRGRWNARRVIEDAFDTEELNSILGEVSQ